MYVEDKPNGLDRQGLGNLGDLCGALARSATQGPADFERVYALGYSKLIPIIPHDAEISPRSSLALRVGKAGAKDPRGKAPGQRGPDGLWSSFSWTTYETTQADLPRWSRSGAGVGLRMGDGLYGIDVDTTDSVLADRARKLIAETIPGAHVERVGRAPKFLVLLRVPEGVRMPYKLVEFGHGEDGKPERIEGLSTGKQAVVSGIHPTTKKPYEWRPAMPPRAKLVEATPEQIAAFFDRVAAEFPGASDVRTEGKGGDRSSDALRGEPTMIEAAVARLPNTTQHFPTRESYRDVAYAIKASMPDNDRAFECFASWSDRWADPPDNVGNVEGYAEAMWRTLRPPFRIGASWLLQKVAAVTGEPVESSWFGPVAAPPSAAANKEEWPTPTDIFGDGSDGPPVELAADILPSTLGSSAKDMAERIGVSQAFAGAAVFATASAAIGAKLRIQPRQLDADWTQPGFLWIGLVEEPGGKKSPIIGAATAPLSKLDARTAAEGRRAFDHWSFRRKRKDATFEAKPPITRYVADRFTMESLTPMLADNPQGILISCDELADLITSLDAYKTAKGGDRTALLRLFDGNSLRVDRVSSGLTNVETWGASVLGGIQPKRIADMAGNLEEDGLLQRFLPIMGDGVRRPGIDRLVDERAKRDYEEAIAGVAAMRLMRPAPVRLSAPAYAELKRLWDRVERLAALPDMSDAWRGHLGKWPGIAARVFLIFHVFDNWPLFEGRCDDLEVDVCTARRAVRFSEFLLAHAMRFYSSCVGLGEVGDRARWIAGFILARCDGDARVTRRTIENARHELRDDVRKIVSAMRLLELVGWVRPDPKSVDRQNHPQAWEINPRIFEAFASRADAEKSRRAHARQKIAAASEERRRILETFDGE